MSKKVLLGLSGGVDSAVAAYLLKQQGYDVTGCFMRNWDSITNNDILGNPTLDGSKCSQELDYDDAVKTAQEIGIPLLRIDFIEEYWNEVFTYFLDEYKKGRTPNPDIFCNKYIKFEAFRKFALENGFEMIAMGHYAKKIVKNGYSYLCKAKDLNKDQSYFLGQVNEEQLSMALFPLAEITKPEVRKIAEKLNLTGAVGIARRYAESFGCLYGRGLALCRNVERAHVKRVVHEYRYYSSVALFERIAWPAPVVTRGYTRIAPLGRYIELLAAGHACGPRYAACCQAVAETAVDAVYDVAVLVQKNPRPPVYRHV